MYLLQYDNEPYTQEKAQKYLCINYKTNKRKFLKWCSTALYLLQSGEKLCPQWKGADVLLTAT